MRGCLSRGLCRRKRRRDVALSSLSGWLVCGLSCVDWPPRAGYPLDDCSCATAPSCGGATPFSGDDQLRAWRGDCLRPHDDPLAVLHLLHTHQIVAVVAWPVEAQLALDRVDGVGLQPLRQHLVIEALGRG